MTQKLTVAVVGLGYFSQFHLAAWRRVDAVGAVHVTDPVADRVTWAQDQFEVVGHADPAALLTDCAPDVVDIVAPPPAHEELIRQFAAPGRILVCQKPFCTSLAQAEEVTAHADAIGAQVVIHENFRFQPWYRTIKAFLEDGRMGQVYQCRFALRPGDGRGEDAYLARQPAFRTMPKFLIHETAVHFLDLFRWLFGDITGVYADIRQLNPALKGEDAGVMILSHTSGAQSIFDGNRLSDHVADNPRRTMGEMVIEGEAGSLHLDGQGQVSFRAFGQGQEVAVPVIAPVDEASFGGGCVEALIRHVVNAACGDGALENRAADYLPVIRAIEAAYASAAQGRKILLD